MKVLLYLSDQIRKDFVPLLQEAQQIHVYSIQESYILELELSGKGRVMIFRHIPLRTSYLIVFN